MGYGHVDGSCRVSQGRVGEGRGREDHVSEGHVVEGHMSEDNHVILECTYVDDSRRSQFYTEETWRREISYEASDCLVSR